ncbi:TonB-dependent receptor [Chitinophaga niabensis]|uniref:SusC/RagA family TonB-linked outer membrane protein n=1 Tax=Chitinophaga niabensis TaxID=536979 RepID=UPI0031BA0334
MTCLSTAASANRTTSTSTYYQQETRELRGRVTDESKAPLPGVTVTLKGSKQGTVTDASGFYSLKVAAASGVLEFTFIGYAKQEQAYSNFKGVDIQMSFDQKALGEVVVVGYGTQKKVNMVGAVSAVKVDEAITSRALPNASSALSGLVPGLAVSTSTGMAGRNGASLMIRGLGTVNNANPLVVVDGMPDVDINLVNINDIESISVLKDATSASVYGSRAANGVILITTKSGKGLKKTQLNLSGSIAVTKPTKAYSFMADYARGLTMHQRQAAVNTARALWNFKDGTIDQWMAMSMIDPLRYPNTDWWDIITRDGNLQNYNISAAGGGENSNFFFSVGVMDEKGLQINNDFKRYNARFNYDYKLRKNMNVGVRFNGSWTKFVFALEDGFTDDNASNTAGFDLQYAIAGITPYDPKTGFYGGVMGYNEDAQAYNPYTVYQNTLNRQDRQGANGNVFIDWSPIKGLTAKVEYALNYYNQFRWNANTPNRAFNFQTGQPGTRIYVGENAGVGNFTNTGYKSMMTSSLNYEKTIAKNHEIKAMVVYSEEYWFDRYQGSSRNDRLHNTLHEVDAALTQIQSANGNSSTEGLRSYIGRFNYTAFEKYLFEFNARYDGSSKFQPGSQYGFFPSVAVGWRFTEENFIKQYTENILSNGKLRASYGSLGNNSGVGRYEQQQTLGDGHYMIDGNIAKGLVNRKLVNPYLSWETNTVFNLGLDLGFFNNRLTAELDYYNRLTTGMNRPTDLSELISGAYIAPRTNIGNLRNRGVELNLTWSDKIGSFRYGINLNGSYNSTTLEKWNEFLGKGFTFIDLPYHFLYTYEDIGIAQTWEDVYNATPQNASPGDILRKDLNGDGRITAEDKKAYPNTQRDRPTTFFALNTNVGWKGIDLAFLWQGATGRKDYVTNNYNNTSPSASRYAWTWDHWYNVWSLDNRGGSLPRLSGNAPREETTFWLDDMTYLRLKNIQLGYTLPGHLLKRIGVNAFRIFGSAENLLTITNYRGLDPEASGNRSNAYPVNKSYSAGVNVGF